MIIGKKGGTGIIPHLTLSNLGVVSNKPHTSIMAEELDLYLENMKGSKNHWFWFQSHSLHYSVLLTTYRGYQESGSRLSRLM